MAQENNANNTQQELEDLHVEKKNRKKWGIFILLLSLLGGGIWFYFTQQPAQVISGEYLGDVKDAKKMTDKKLGAIEQKEVDKSKFNMVIKPEITLHTKAKLGDSYIQNPIHNAYPVDVELIIDGQVIYTTGAIEPGYEVTSIELNKEVEMDSGTYGGVARFKIYDTITKKQRGQTEATVSVTVVND